MIVEDFQSKLNLIKERIKNIDKPLILELGVKEGRSTKMFLEICDKNDGNLISIDILDYSKVSNNPKWKFIHSSDDNFEYINKFSFFLLTVRISRLNILSDVPRLELRFWVHSRCGLCCPEQAWAQTLGNNLRSRRRYRRMRGCR